MAVGISGLVLLDLRLPGMTGLEVLRTLRDRGITTPILVLTAQDAVGHKVEALRAGADDYVTKPFAFEEVLARVEALSRRPKQLTSQKLTAGGRGIQVLRAGRCTGVVQTWGRGATIPGRRLRGRVAESCRPGIRANPRRSCTPDSRHGASRARARRATRRAGAGSRVRRPA